MPSAPATADSGNPLFGLGCNRASLETMRADCLASSFMTQAPAMSNKAVIRAGIQWAQSSRRAEAQPRCRYFSFL
ncbi:hypothetical protein D1872_318110 [compost metagenome]